MPGGDRTGPAGMGPMTGRAAGFCAGYGVPGSANFMGGRGNRGQCRGFGGGGRGRRNWYYATGLPGWARAAQGIPAWGAVGGSFVQSPSAQQEIEILKDQQEYLKDTLDGISKRIGELENQEDSQVNAEKTDDP